jgi:hypothetical protein
MSQNNQSTDPNHLLEAQTDALLGMYCESRTHARHYEDQRATVSNIIMLATVGLIGFIAQGELARDAWLLTVAIALVGAFGAVFTALYFRRIKRFEKQADEYRLALDVLVFGWSPEGKKLEPRTLDAILTEADLPDKDKRYAKEYGTRTKPERMAWFRMFWPLAITILAIAATFYFRSKGNKSEVTYKIKTDSGGCVVKVEKD